MRLCLLIPLNRIQVLGMSNAAIFSIYTKKKSCMDTDLYNHCVTSPSGQIYFGNKPQLIE